jgi:hypothetical protein
MGVMNDAAGHGRPTGELEVASVTLRFDDARVGRRSRAASDTPARVVHAMEHDDTPKGRPRSRKAVPTPTPTEEELSRIARGAVRQRPDPRLDKQLERMGLMDADEPAEPQPGQTTGRSVVIGPELERLRKGLRRIEVILWVLVAVIGILAVMVVVLLSR